MFGGLEYCTYCTPCGWCSKWDKKCDKKISERGQRAKCNLLDDAMDNSLIETEECNHKWEPTNSGGAFTGIDGLNKVYTTYRCKYCGETKDM